MNDRDKIEVGSEIVEFYRDFVRLIEMQLIAVRSQVDDTVQTLMKSIDKVNKETTKVSNQAEKSLTDKFTNPDPEDATIIQRIQKEVSRVFDEATGQTSEGATDKESGEYLRLLKMVDRNFSGDMKNLNHVDGVLQNALMTMMGTLSMEDVIAQRVDHVENSINVVHGQLKEMVKELGMNKSKRLDVDAYSKSALRRTFEVYTTEDEKEIFRAVFGNKVV